MKYFKCKWIHDDDDDPILFFSEIDEDRYENRKIEIFRNGSIGFADNNMHSEKTELGIVPVPPLTEINEEEYEEFEAEYITKEIFEKEWNKITRSINSSSK